METGRKGPRAPERYPRESIFLDNVGGARVATLLASHPVGPVACDCWKIVYVTAGSAALRVNESFTREIRAGDLIMLRQGAVYSVVPIVPTTATIVYVDHVFMSSNLSWLLRLPENQAVIRALLNHNDPAWVLRPGVEQVNQVGRVFAAISNAPMEEMRPPDKGNTTLHELARLFDVLEVVRLLAGDEPPAPASTRRTPSATWPTGRDEVVRAARLMHDHLRTRWTLRRLSAAVNVSPSHLSTLFRAEIGAPPMKYLMELRLQRLAYLLVTSSLGVAEASLRSGWRDADYAAKLFRRRFGVSPSAYRKSTSITPSTTVPGA